MLGLDGWGISKLLHNDVTSDVM